MRPPPPTRPPSPVVEVVAPVVDAGRLPAKATIDEPLEVHADAFTAGHQVIDVALRRRRCGRGRAAAWSESPMTALGNDRFVGSFVPDALGRWEYDVVAWVDHAETWRRAVVAKLAAGLDVHLELLDGATLVDELIDRAPAGSADADRLIALRDELGRGETASLGDASWSAVFWRTAPREPAAHLASPVPFDVDRRLARTSAWYEFFPRSPVSPDSGHGTLRDAIDRLDHVASMGFDVVYLPPVHPIGSTKRKGPNNAVTARDGDVGSPWAIGSPDGGHTAVHPALGTIDDVEQLAAACRARGLELALDIAFQCSPDHPWVTEHPDWFAHRADGSVQFAENPPKRYEDIYPLDFESEDWRNLWCALADVIRFWIDRGVTVFRVDNPHTKSLAFWEWALSEIRREHPETIFLAEAFTRPRLMEHLAKIGFNQSYTYFTWRQSAAELREYFTELSTRTVDYLRPNAWPNTPDILTEQLQHGGRAAFVTRAILAATLAPSWGVYGPAFELLEQDAVRAGSEEYLDSEKYQLRRWDLDREDSLAPLLRRLNEIRHAQPALGQLRTLRFHETDQPDLLCFSKTDPRGVGEPILVVVNVDTEQRHAGFVDVDLAPLGMPYGAAYDVVDLLGGGTYRWQGNWNYVDLAPGSASAHVFAVRPLRGAAIDDIPDNDLEAGA